MASNVHVSFANVRLKFPQRTIGLIGLEVESAKSHPFAGRVNMYFYYQKLEEKLMEIEKKIVREVARSDKQYLKQSSNCKAQVRKAFVSLIELTCALQSADCFIEDCL